MAEQPQGRTDRLNLRQYDLSAPDAPVLYFFHIPKTAGTSLRVMLSAHFPTDRVLPNEQSAVYLWDDLIKIPTEVLGRYALLCGHYYNPLYQRLPRPPAAITFLREPAAQTLSAYQNLWQHPEHYFHRKARQLGNLPDFLRDPEARRLFTNFQTRMLALDPDLAALSAMVDPADSHGLQKAIELAVPEISDTELLARAKARLDSFTMVGVMERFQDSIWLLDYLFGWWPETKLARLNTAPRDRNHDDISPETRGLIRALTPLDDELYRYAEARLNADFSQMMTEMLEEHSGTFRPRWSDSQPVVLAFDHDLPGEGWYPPERDAEGELFRWLGPAPQATISLALPTDRPITVSGYIAFGTSLDMLNSLRLTVDDSDVALTFTPAGPFSYTFSGVIPPRAATASRLRHLTFRVSHVDCPRERDPSSNDERFLSLAFRWLQFSFTSNEKC